ncbi:hypothetical protein VKT23_004898 [Stygiomarasmius scandens]|uniref:F-box domain-containing protein n=1 Tax=Marasmiellus scandens TaxID=2682957 RepID=A0ABR1JUF1_9AGAR
MVVFPAELEEHLIDSIPRSDTETLKSCSLVCQSWRPRSQYLLFNKTISFISRGSDSSAPTNTLAPSDLKSFLEIVRSSKTIMHAVCGLRLPRGVLSRDFAYPLGLSNLLTLEIADINMYEVVNRIHPSFRRLLLQNPKLKELKFERINVHEGILIPIFETLKALRLPTTSKLLNAKPDQPGSPLRLLSFYKCSFVEKPYMQGQSNVTSHDTSYPLSLKFQGLTLSLTGTVRNLGDFVETFHIQGLRGIVLGTLLSTVREETHEAVATLLNRHVGEIRSLSIRGMTYKTNLLQDGFMILDTFEKVPFSQMYNLTELNLHSCTTSSDAVKYLIEKLTQGSGVNIPLERFNVWVDFKEGMLEADDDLSTLVMVKKDTLKEVTIYGGGIGEEVLRMALPRTSRFEQVRFLRQAKET